MQVTHVFFVTPQERLDPIGGKPFPLTGEEFWVPNRCRMLNLEKSHGGMPDFSTLNMAPNATRMVAGGGVFSRTWCGEITKDPVPTEICGTLVRIPVNSDGV